MTRRQAADEEMREKKHFLPWALALFFLGILVTGGLHLRALLGEYAAGETAYETLGEYVRHPVEAPAETPSPPEMGGEGVVPVEPRQGPEVDFEALSAINPDVVAWLSIDGTGIDYPIVQGEDDRYYLNHLFTGEKNRAGCLFLDSENAADFSDGNSVVYGHYLKDGTMFSSLLKYKKQDYFDAHPSGWLVTPERTYRVHFFSGFVSNVQGDAWTTAPDAPWSAQMAQNSLFSADVTPHPADQFLTLSTCSYEFKNARFVLIGVMEEA